MRPLQEKATRISRALDCSDQQLGLDCDGELGALRNRVYGFFPVPPCSDPRRLQTFVPFGLRPKLLSATLPGDVARIWRNERFRQFRATFLKFNAAAGTRGRAFILPSITRALRTVPL